VRGKDIRRGDNIRKGGKDIKKGGMLLLLFLNLREERRGRNE